MKNNKIGILLVLMLFVGVCGLLYPSVSQYWNTKTQTRAIENYREILSTLRPEDYEAYFQEAESYNTALHALSEPLLDYGKVENYNQVLNIGGNGIMGYISIPKIGVELPLYHGISTEVLNIACGHLEGSSLPVGGESTHTVLSAHRGLPHAKLFTELDKMEVGDTFTITVLNRTITYQVDQIKVVRPDEIDDIQVIPGEDLCTLLTCTPYGVNSHRLLVRGHRTENVEDYTSITANAVEFSSFTVATAIAIPILIVLFLIVMISTRKKKNDKIMKAFEEDKLNK